MQSCDQGRQEAKAASYVLVRLERQEDVLWVTLRDPGSGETLRAAYPAAAGDDSADECLRRLSESFVQGTAVEPAVSKQNSDQNMPEAVISGLPEPD